MLQSFLTIHPHIRASSVVIKDITARSKNGSLRFKKEKQRREKTVYEENASKRRFLL